jgi:DNA-binding MarR family transcriptional regulator
MNKKELFVMMVEAFLEKGTVEGTLSTSQLDEAIAYFNAFKSTQDKKADKPQFTDNGKLILKAMIENNEERANMFSAKQIAEYAFITSRQVSGAIRKLVADGYCEKVGQDPIIYSLTDLGKQIDVASLE